MCPVSAMLRFDIAAQWENVSCYISSAVAQYFPSLWLKPLQYVHTLAQNSLVSLCNNPRGKSIRSRKTQTLEKRHCVYGLERADAFPGKMDCNLTVRVIVFSQKHVAQKTSIYPPRCFLLIWSQTMGWGSCDGYTHCQIERERDDDHTKVVRNSSFVLMSLELWFVGCSN